MDVGNKLTGRTSEEERNSFLRIVDTMQIRSHSINYQA